MVTGATHGIGYEVARRLALRDTFVIVHGPTPSQAHAAVAGLIRDGVDAHMLEPVAADFRRLADVVSLGKYLDRRHAALDLLVNNAGAATPIAESWNVNYLGHYALTRLLAPGLKAAGGRVISVTSALHREATLGLTPVTPRGAYAKAKLALTMFTRCLRVAVEDPIEAVAVHPGYVDTGAFTEFYGMGGLPVRDAAAAVLDTGKYFYYEGHFRADAAPEVYDDEALRWLWHQSERALAWDHAPAA
jgi:NAD(P)-dependent dehydrogenase (short-subunit alcohol dehydrogenase family)